MPTVEEVCKSFGLNDVQIEYSEADFANFTTFKLFQQPIRPMLAKDNPKVKHNMEFFVQLAHLWEFNMLN